MSSVTSCSPQSFGLAGIRQPIPAEHAFAADGQVVAIGSDEFEEVVEVVMADIGVEEFFALSIHEAYVHLAGVQVDSQLNSVLEE